ncbi:hypothetical protein Ahy_A02g009686 isoform B [Arachis hypogaea]|uniref:Uncharacterized protein n=1 Tax=Arachis hypogaea TaxID=3818 RepID=A0A445EHY3_ARAHY|nr:hypothetical protein Ahy_A02g009686 isoform B [Arachis hypogaea]
MVPHHHHYVLFNILFSSFKSSNEKVSLFSYHISRSTRFLPFQRVSLAAASCNVILVGTLRRYKGAGGGGLAMMVTPVVGEADVRRIGRSEIPFQTFNGILGMNGGYHGVESRNHQ